MKKSTLRWVPAIAVPAIVIAGALTIPQMANASVTLPAKSAEQILALVEKSAGTSFSGTISETANLGLPDLSSSALGGSSSSETSSILSALTGTHKANIFVSGTTAERIQTLDNLAETDVIRSGKTIWTYDSQKNTATEVTLPDAHRAMKQQPTVTETPSQVAAAALAAIGTDTTVTTASTVMVAGQKAYQVTLTPKDSSTLVGNVTLAVDASTGVPLSASITAAGASSAAFSVAFTSIDYSTPSASTFAFTPPTGATVKKIAVPTHGTSTSHFAHPGALSQEQATKNAQKSAKPKPIVIGSGWSTIIGTTLSAKELSSIESSKLTDELLTSVTGGKVLQTALVSIYLGDNGQVFVGAVSASTLEAAVAAQK